MQGENFSYGNNFEIITIALLYQGLKVMVAELVFGAALILKEQVCAMSIHVESANIST